jgi:hypothetical protein|tara:strand:+ start:1477 stop:1770 length:294 start_codon:yes stop_codon:yes gene_type:complete
MNKTVKKVLIAAVFLGGGILFIKKILPMLIGDIDSLENSDGDVFQVTDESDIIPEKDPKLGGRIGWNPYSLEGNQSGGKVPIAAVIDYVDNSNNVIL